MPKPEGRSPKEIRKSAPGSMGLTAVIRAWGFGLLSDFGPSGFGFRETGIVIQTQWQ
jgi:hypothetical protein